MPMSLEVVSAGWGNFLVAEVSASAALAGLIFVGVSINLTRIMSFKGLPERALEGLLVLLAVLVASSLLLAPDQSLTVVGAELLAVGGAFWLATAAILIQALRTIEVKYALGYGLRIVGAQVATLPWLIGGVVTLTQGSVGLYWMIPAVIGSFLTAFMNAWVLLIEINR